LGERSGRGSGDQENKRQQRPKLDETSAVNRCLCKRHFFLQRNFFILKKEPANLQGIFYDAPVWLMVVLGNKNRDRQP